jgi:hypothetical protein
MARGLRALSVGFAGRPRGRGCRGGREYGGKGGGTLAVVGVRVTCPVSMAAWRPRPRHTRARRSCCSLRPYSSPTREGGWGRGGRGERHSFLSRCSFSPFGPFLSPLQAAGPRRVGAARSAGGLLVWRAKDSSPPWWARGRSRRARTCVGGRGKLCGDGAWRRCAAKPLATSSPSILCAVSVMYHWRRWMCPASSCVEYRATAGSSAARESAVRPDCRPPRRRHAIAFCRVSSHRVRRAQELAHHRTWSGENGRRRRPSAALPSRRGGGHRCGV